MGQLAISVRRNRAAGVEIRIDRRAERARAFKPRIEIETKFTRHIEIGPQPRRNDDAIDGPRINRPG